MQRKNAILLAVVAVAAAVGGAVLWAGGDTGLQPTDSPQVAPMPPSEPPVQTPGPQDPAPAVPADAPRVVVQVVEREPLSPPPTPRVRAWQLPQRTGLPLRVLGGIGSSPWDDDARGGTALVEIERSGQRLVRHVGLEPGATADVELAGDLQVRGTVLDDRQRPVADATVWLGTRDGDGGLNEVRTGEDGVFIGSVPASGGVPIVVRRDGFASTWQAATVAVDTARDFTITLAHGAVLGVQVAGQAELVERGEVFLAPGDVRDAALSRYPFFLQCVLGGVRLDGLGRAEIPGLPQQGDVGVVVVHPLVPITAGATAKLTGGRAECLLPMQFHRGAAGRVVAADGAPVAGASLLWRPLGDAVPTFSGSRLLPSELAAIGGFFTRADGDGRFVLPEGAAKGPVLVRAAGFAGRDVALPADGAAIQLEPWRGGEPSLCVLPPRKGAIWRVEFDLGSGTAFACKPDEPAVVSTPHAGRFDVFVRTFVGDELRGERRVDGLVVTGPTEVTPPPADPGH